MESRVFIELSIFRSKVDALGGVELLKVIQAEILKDPARGDLISGAAGVRKLRVAKPRGGKSGGYRVFYLDLPDLGHTYLMTLLDKRESENISDEEKAILRTLAKKIKVK